MKADVIQSYQNLLQTQLLYQQFDRRFVVDLDSLNLEVTRNYEKRNLSLLEFLDFYDAYKTNKVQLNNLLSNRAVALESLSFSTGKEIIRYP